MPPLRAEDWPVVRRHPWFCLYERSRLAAIESYETLVTPEHRLFASMLVCRLWSDQLDYITEIMREITDPYSDVVLRFLTPWAATAESDYLGPEGWAAVMKLQAGEVQPALGERLYQAVTSRVEQMRQEDIDRARQHAAKLKQEIDALGDRPQV